MISLFQYYRIVAAYLILLIHQQFWTKPMVVSSLTHVAVPLFAAMAGFLFAHSVGGEILPTLTKKVKRILFPYLIWAVIYWGANGVILDGLVRHEAITVPGVRSWLLGGTACHLWFLPCLFVAFAVFALVEPRNTRNNTEAIRIKCVVIDLMAIVLSACTQFIDAPTSATFPGYVRLYFGRLVFYFAVGHLLALIPVARIVAASYVGGILIMLGLANVVFQWVEGLVWNPLLLVIGLIMAAGCFRNLSVPKWVDRMAVASMGIYLVHVLFTSGANFALQKIGHSPLPALMGFALSVVLFAASYVMVRLLPRKLF